MSALRISMHILIACCVSCSLSSCIFAFPIVRGQEFKHSDSRTQISWTDCKRLCKRTASFENVVLNVGSPLHIDSERREAIYHSALLHYLRAELVVGAVGFGGGDVTGFPASPKSYTYRDYFFRFKFNEHWKLIGVRHYQLDRKATVDAPTDYYKNYPKLLNDFFLEQQCSAPGHKKVWPPNKRVKPAWVKKESTQIKSKKGKQR